MGEAPEPAEEAWVVPTEVWGATAGTPAVPLGVETPLELALFPAARARSRCSDPPPAMLTPATSMAASRSPDTAPASRAPHVHGLPSAPALSDRII